VIRRVGNSPVTPFLGGGTAVLLQVAHPLVAAGVAEHSDYRRDLWSRLGRTLRALYLITFGTKDEAEEAGAAVRAVHAHIRGQTRIDLGCFPQGTRYDAGDPQLMLWVYATLIDASLSAYQRFDSRLTDDEQERYYREMAVVAQLFGTPAAVIPRTLGEFRSYFDAQIAGTTIAVTPPAREIAEVILEAPLPALLRMFGPTHRLATAAQLPPRLRSEYALRWNPRNALTLQVAARALKLTAWPVLLTASKFSPPLKTATA
jgi:uncharacterized protein (DUF2236 family)